MSSIEFVQSSKSETVLIVDGYEYYKKRENRLTTAWKCAQYQTLSCRTSAFTNGEQQISIRGNHNHDIYMGKIRARKVSKKIKEVSEFSTPAVSDASALLKVLNEYATQLTLSSVSSKFLKEWDKNGFDPLSRPGKPKLRRAWRNSSFFGAQHWKRTQWKDKGFQRQWNDEIFAVISIMAGRWDI